ncbi:MAG TPA: SH3 domain-containing protein [Candidatus Saccharicenans sp.]|jgi:hypothetical protein|nr:SH3 domain-containing protein [Candidatus Saccharicenans sp.]HRD01537.1 SH3 domain-containing protein [Candidatus Saccharicenans sp.]
MNKREKITWCLILALLSLGWLALGLRAQSQNLRVRVVSEQANVRVKPDISSEMLFQVPEGTEFQVEKKEGEWFLILFEKADGTKGKGYVHESLVEAITPVGRAQAVPKKNEKPAETRKTEPVKEAKQPEARGETSRKSGASGVSVSSVLKKISLSVHGLLNYLSPSDLNQAAEGVTNYYYLAFGYNRKADLTGLHFGSGYGFDLFYKFYPGLHLGLGFDYYQPSKNNRANFTTSRTNYSVWTKVGVKDLPLRISLMFQPVERFYLKTGIEYHLAKANYLYSVYQSVGTPEENWMSWTGQASGHSFGWLAAAGLNRPITSWCHFFLEGFYRSARVKNFDGNNFYLDSDGFKQTESGDLYYWQALVSPNTSYPVLFIRDQAPAEPGVINPRKAEINYSGFSLKAGLRFRF